MHLKVKNKWTKRYLLLFWGKDQNQHLGMLKDYLRTFFYFSYFFSILYLLKQVHLKRDIENNTHWDSS